MNDGGWFGMLVVETIAKRPPLPGFQCRWRIRVIPAIRTLEDLDKLLEKTSTNFNTDAFLIERLGASRFLDPELTYVLIQLRRESLGNTSQTQRLEIALHLVRFAQKKELLTREVSAKPRELVKQPVGGSLSFV